MDGEGVITFSPNQTTTEVTTATKVSLLCAPQETVTSASWKPKKKRNEFDSKVGKKKTGRHTERARIEKALNLFTVTQPSFVMSSHTLNMNSCVKNQRTAINESKTSSNQRKVLYI